jgi:hypothetical protein
MGVPGETLAAIVSCRDAGVIPLRDQLRQRVDLLSPHLDFAEADARTALAEVFEAYEPAGFLLSPMSERCAIERENGGSIVIGGKLLVGGREVGLLQRRLLLGLGIAVHELLVLEHGARGFGVSSVLLKRCFALYDELGFERVILQTDLTGKWHWARLGFDFVLDKERKMVREWTKRALSALGITNLRVEGYESAAQFARMGGARKLALEELARALPPERPRITRIAGENGLRLDQEVDLARALMLCGPQWWGALELQGPGRVAFEAYAEAKIRGGR